MRLWIFECREPSEDAFKLGLAAAALLAFAHILSNLLGGCMCICSQEDFQKASPNRQLSVVCLVFSWYIYLPLFEFLQKISFGYCLIIQDFDSKWFKTHTLMASNLFQKVWVNSNLVWVWIIGMILCIVSNFLSHWLWARKIIFDLDFFNFLEWLIRIILAVGFSMLVIGTLSNHKSRTSCGFSHHHFLSIGGILCFVHALFCVAYYVSATAALNE